jgi:TetR/AcrR family transcriptional repressor of mexJK operon
MEAKANARLSDARRDDIVETAWSIFLEHGYSGASMAEIAQRLGGSKATLYNYFPSKDLLFREVITRKGDELYTRLNAIPFDFTDLRAGLIEFGIRLIRVVTSEKYVTVHRLVISESGRFTHLDPDDIDARRSDVLAPLSRRIAEQMDAGVLRRADPLDASEAFWNLCNGTVHRLALMTANLRLDAKRMRDIAERATTIFLAAYAPPGNPAPERAPADGPCG